MVSYSITFALSIGQPCLPGGNREDKDATPVETALREAEEEVGLDPNLVEVVSVLPPAVA